MFPLRTFLRTIAGLVLVLAGLTPCSSLSQGPELFVLEPVDHPLLLESLSDRYDKNHKLISPLIKLVRRKRNTGYQETHKNLAEIACHFLRRQTKAITVFSLCGNYQTGVHMNEDGLYGIEADQLSNILNATVRISSPMKNKYKFEDDAVSIDTMRNMYGDSGEGRPSPRRFDLNNQVESNSIFPSLGHHRRGNNKHLYSDPAVPPDQTYGPIKVPKKVIELAVFMDERAFRSAQFSNSRKISAENLILGIINQVQAIYYHPSLGNQVDIVVSYMEIMERDPDELAQLDGERTTVLTAFCNYTHMRKSDLSIDWDMSVLLTGMDLHAKSSNGAVNRRTMGLAVINGVCLSKYSCAIVEFGVVTDSGFPYPSSGFATAYILAHEMAHNLGLQHDGDLDDCPSDGFIMSRSRSGHGETSWSKCSARLLSHIYHPCLYNQPQDHRTYTLRDRLPGLGWDADKQCQVFVRDRRSAVYPTQQWKEVCHSLTCEGRDSVRAIVAGPALDGTFCGEGKLCLYGECQSMAKIPILYTYLRVGGWGTWMKDTPCQHPCILGSKSIQALRRECDSPEPLFTRKGCEGDSSMFMFCSPVKRCITQVSAENYATMKCQTFSITLPQTSLTAFGMQIKHSLKKDRQWQSCAIFCRLQSGTWYSPRDELNRLNIDPYFPDGTWCHHDGSQNYFCANHQCVPESNIYKPKS